jgi:transcriptional regulator of heat shock response
MLSAARLRELTQNALQKTSIKVSAKFAAALTNFLEDIAQQIQHLQAKFKDDAFLRNFTHITQNEFDAFMSLVW